VAVIVYTIDYSGLQQLQANLARNPAVVREELSAAVTEADLLLEREVKENAPVGAGGAAGFKGSVYHVEEINDTSVVGLVSTSVSHAVPVELGTRPHFPPIEPLIDWVKAKFGISSEKEARGAAFLVARKISRRGTQAQRPFGRTFQALEHQVNAIFDRAAARIAARLAGGG
jgi:hypothetical protein